MKNKAIINLDVFFFLIFYFPVVLFPLDEFIDFTSSWWFIILFTGFISLFMHCILSQQMNDICLYNSKINLIKINTEIYYAGLGMFIPSIVVSVILVLGRSELDLVRFIYLLMFVIYGFCGFRIKIVKIDDSEEKNKISNNQTHTG